MLPQPSQTRKKRRQAVSRAPLVNSGINNASRVIKDAASKRTPAVSRLNRWNLCNKSSVVRTSEEGGADELSSGVPGVCLLCVVDLDDFGGVFLLFIGIMIIPVCFH